MIEAWRALDQIEERNKNWQAVFSAHAGLPSSTRKISRLGFGSLNLLCSEVRLDEALNWVNQAGEIDPKNTAALTLKAAILLKLNDNNGAIQEAQKALEIEPGNVASIMVLAAEKYSRDDTKGALRILDDVSPAQKEDLGVILLKIKIFEKMGDLQQLELQLRKLVELRPDEVSFKAELVKFYVAHQRQDDAEKEMRAIAAANPANTAAALDVVRFLRAVKGSAAARQELDVRIKAGGNVFPFQMALADLDFLEGNFTASSQLLEKLISSAAVSGGRQCRADQTRCNATQQKKHSRGGGVDCRYSSHRQP